MTISEMHIAFDLLLDKSNSLQYPSFLPEEKDFWLNLAIRKFVKTRYSGVNPKREGFEQSQKRIDDLRTLVVEKQLACTSIGAIKPNGYVISGGLTGSNFTATPYWLSLGEEVDITFIPTNPSLLAFGATTTTKRVGVTDVTANDYRYKLDDPTGAYILHYDEARPLRLFYNDTIEFITDGNYSIPYAYLRFLRKPATVSLSLVVSCDLAEHTHDEIVALAVQEALEGIEQPRLESYSQLVNTME
jgi:hypothetical protein